MNDHHSGRAVHQDGGGYRQPNNEAPILDLSEIILRSPKPDLFDGVAEKVAKTLGYDPDKVNRIAQIRRFYDEVCRFSDGLHRADDAQFMKTLPYIRMINARVAYAHGRKAEGGTLVDENFFNFMRHCLNQVENLKTLQTFRTFFEAVIGFYPKKKGGRP